MLTKLPSEKLKKNWGPLAEAMQCNAEIRLYDPLSSWECYIYALNPENEEQVLCIINGFFPQVCESSLNELFSFYNSAGEMPQIDYEYRPRNAEEIYKTLRDKDRYDTDRN